MILSSEQVKAFWRLWAQACRTQGWTDKAAAETQRKQLLARCGFSSLTKVDRLAGFTRVKNELIILSSNQSNLAAAAEATDPTANRARVWRHLIRREILPCLSLYEADATAYMRSVMRDKNRWWKIDRPEADIALEDLDAHPVVRVKDGEPQEFPSPLEQLLMTLNARLHAKRQAAGHSLHDMKLAAGVKCDCRACRAEAELPEPDVVEAENCPF